MISKYSYQFEDIDDVVVEHPNGYVFLRERNYLKIYTAHDSNITLVSVTIAGKSINFNYDLSKPITFDVTPYYAKGATSIAVSVKFNDVTDTFTIPLSIKAFDCYSPYKEITASVCRETVFAVITPPNRMIKGADSVRSLFVAKRAVNASSTEIYVWSFNGGKFDGSETIMRSVNIDKTFKAEYIATNITNTERRVLNTITRAVESRDTTRDIVYVTWKTPWGFDVSHVFYLDTFGTDKEDAKEVESLYFYEERSKHVIKGSFYLDNIRSPYDLWYYQTLAKSERVTMALDTWRTLANVYMPLSTNEYNGIRITGTNIKDAVVDGVTQKTITFDFEML